MIRIPQAIYDEMVAHGKEAYPNECCGALIGSISSDKVKSVIESKRLTNTNAERSADRYSIDGLEYSKVERAADEQGLQMLGIYHTHPDHPDEPSDFDREVAWPDFSYVIIAVAGSGEISARSWTFSEPEAPFSKEELDTGK